MQRRIKEICEARFHTHSVIDVAPNGLEWEEIVDVAIAQFIVTVDTFARRRDIPPDGCKLLVFDEDLYTSGIDAMRMISSPEGFICAEPMSRNTKDLFGDKIVKKLRAECTDDDPEGQPIIEVAKTSGSFFCVSYGHLKRLRDSLNIPERELELTIPEHIRGGLRKYSEHLFENVDLHPSVRVQANIGGGEFTQSFSEYYPFIVEGENISEPRGNDLWDKIDELSMRVERGYVPKGLHSETDGREQGESTEDSAASTVAEGE